MTLRRQGFHNGVMTYILRFGESSIHIIFMARVVFIKVIFLYLNLKPDDGFLPHSMLEIFRKTGYGLKSL